MPTVPSIHFGVDNLIFVPEDRTLRIFDLFHWRVIEIPVHEARVRVRATAMGRIEEAVRDLVKTYLKSPDGKARRAEAQGTADRFLRGMIESALRAGDLGLRADPTAEPLTGPTAKSPAGPTARPSAKRPGRDSGEPPLADAEWIDRQAAPGHLTVWVRLSDAPVESFFEEDYDSAGWSEDGGGHDHDHNRDRDEASHRSHDHHDHHDHGHGHAARHGERCVCGHDTVDDDSDSERDSDFRERAARRGDAMDFLPPNIRAILEGAGKRATGRGSHSAPKSNKPAPDAAPESSSASAPLSVSKSVPKSVTPSVFNSVSGGATGAASAATPGGPRPRPSQPGFGIPVYGSVVLATVGEGEIALPESGPESAFLLELPSESSFRVGPIDPMEPLPILREFCGDGGASNQGNAVNYNLKSKISKEKLGCVPLHRVGSGGFATLYFHLETAESKADLLVRIRGNKLALGRKKIVMLGYTKVKEGPRYEIWERAARGDVLHVYDEIPGREAEMMPWLSPFVLAARASGGFDPGERSRLIGELVTPGAAGAP